MTGFQATLAQVQGLLARESDRQLLGQLLGDLKKTQGDLERVGPPAIQGVTQSIAQTQAGAQENLETITRLREEVAARVRQAEAKPAAAAPAAPAPPPEEDLDPNWAPA